MNCLQLDIFSQPLSIKVMLSQESSRGKPVDIGGTLGRREATGRGIGYIVEQAGNHLGKDLSKSSALVQGFGNVGLVTARELGRLGVKVVGVSDRSGGDRQPKGPSDRSCRQAQTTK